MGSEINDPPPPPILPSHAQSWVYPLCSFLLIWVVRACLQEGSMLDRQLGWYQQLA